MKKFLLYLFLGLGFLSFSDEAVAQKITVTPKNLLLDSTCLGSPKSATVEFFLAMGRKGFNITGVSLKAGSSKFTHTHTGTKYVGQGSDSFYFFQFTADASSIGTYTDTLLITHTSSDTVSPIKIPARIIVMPQPNAEFELKTGVPDAQCFTNNSFEFVNKSTVSSGYLTYTWDFADGTPQDTNKNPVHTFKTEGDIFVILTVKSSLSNCSHNFPLGITIHPKPNYKFQFDDSTQCFKGNSFGVADISTISSGSIVDKKWTMGDGSAEKSNVDSVRYSYPRDSTGPFKISLVTISSRGCRDTGYANAYVMPMPRSGYTVNDSDQCVNNNNFVFTDTTKLKTGYGGHTVLWSFGDGDTSTKKTVNNKNYTSPGLKKVILVAISDSGCLDTTTSAVYIDFKPNPSMIVDDSFKCSNEKAFEFTNKTTIGSLDRIDYYLFYGDSTTDYFLGGNNFVTSTKQYAGGKTYYAKLLAISEKGCTDTFVTHAIRVLPAPFSDFSVDKTSACFKTQGFQFTYNATITSGTITDYRWFLGENDSTTVQNPYKPAFATHGTYTVMLYTKSDQGCTDTQKKVITINPEPVAGITINDSTQCFEGHSFKVDDNSTLAAGSLSNYYIDMGDNKGFSTTSTITYKYDSIAANYTIFYRIGSSAGCFDSLTRKVFLDKGPNSSFTINLDSQCLRGNRFDFTNTTNPVPPLNTVTWMYGTPANDQSNGFNGSFSYATAGYYNVSLVMTDGTTGCRNTVSRKLQVYPMPNARFSVNAKQLCLEGNTINFTNTSTIPVGFTMSYSWDFDDGTPVSNNQHEVHSYAATGTYNVRLNVVSDRNCDSSFGETITIWPMPIPSYTVNDSTQCEEGQSFDFTNTSTIESGTMTYTWNANGDITTGQDLQDKVFGVFGVYPVSLKVRSNFGCEATIASNVEVYEHASPSLVINDPSGPDPVGAQCFLGNEFIFIDASTPPPGDTITISYDLGEGPVQYGDTARISYSTFGTYHITFIVETKNGCRDTIEKDVYVVPDPVAIIEPEDTIQCLDGNNFLFRNVSTVADPNVQLISDWEFGDGVGVYDDSLQKDVNHSFLIEGDWIVHLMVRTNTQYISCSSEVYQTITVIPPPNAKFTGLEDSYCIGGDQDTLIPVVRINNVQFVGDNVANADTIGIFTPIQVGWNHISYSINIFGCSDTVTDSTYIVVPLDNIVTLGPDTIICKKDAICFDLATPFGKVLWGDQDTFSDKCIYESGIHYVTVSNACGAYTDSVEIEYIDHYCDAFVSSSFTPDANNINDYFMPYIDTNVVTGFEFIVFDRWGTVVFRVVDDFNNPGWDGKYGPASARVESPQDVYGWYLNLKVTRGMITEPREVKGIVHLLR